MDKVLAKLIRDNKESIDDERLEGHFSCILFDEKTPQALTLDPQKFFVFTTGLIDLCQNENELAYVIAKSLSHYILKHKREACCELWPPKGSIIKTFKMMYYKNFWYFASSAKFFERFDIDILNKIDSIDAYTANYFRNAFHQMEMEKVHSQEIEEEADRIALQLLARSCYDVRDAVTFVEKCSKLSKDPEYSKVISNLPINNFLLLHKFDDERLEFLHGIIDKFVQFRLSCDCEPLK